MALTAPQKIKVRVLVADAMNNRREAFALNKPDLDAAIAAVDAWVDSNASSYNTALPTAARNNLTAPQKAELLTLVCSVRFSG